MNERLLAIAVARAYKPVSCPVYEVGFPKTIAELIGKVDGQRRLRDQLVRMLRLWTS